MSNIGFDIWGVVASALGTIALAPVIWSWIQPRLPTSMISSVVEIHKESQELFATALRDGLFTDPDEVYHFQENLLDATTRVDSVRAEVYVIQSWRQDVAAWWRGLSRNIRVLRESLNFLRAKMAGRASHERNMRAAARGLKNDTAYSPLDRKDIGCNKACQPFPPGLPHEFERAASYHEQCTALRHAPGTCSHVAASGSRRCYHAQHDQHAPFSPCSWTGSVKNDHEACSVQHDSCSATAPTQRHVSDTDLQSLLSLAFSRPRTWLGTRPKRAGINGKAQGGRPSRRPCDPFESPTRERDSLPTRRKAMHPQLQDVLRMVRRIYGVDVGVRRGGGKASEAGSTVKLDPESLTPQYAEASDSDDSSEEWEEDCQ
ncbi:hypothetical protein FKP32DRAFT_1754062 [Trametes sanguinea]|nr:hypothetical protein FKP32DRAFT_1754062 [Trametes sanguinea]